MLCVALSGIASLLLPEGITAHSRFQIPLNCTSTSTCRIIQQFNLAALIQAVTLIIWDEALMQHKFNLMAVNTTLCDIQQNEHLFSGIPVVFRGDFAQTLPVITHGNYADSVSACMQQTLWWQNLHILTLTENMCLDTGLQNREWAE